jgi:hypothetical protein
MELSDVVDYRYLAINTGSSISISVTYIVFLAKLSNHLRPPTLQPKKGLHFTRKIFMGVFRFAKKRGLKI